MANTETYACVRTGRRHHRAEETRRRESPMTYRVYPIRILNRWPIESSGVNRWSKNISNKHPPNRLTLNICCQCFYTRNGRSLDLRCQIHIYHHGSPCILACCINCLWKTQETVKNVVSSRWISYCQYTVLGPWRSGVGTWSRRSQFLMKRCDV